MCTSDADCFTGSDEFRGVCDGGMRENFFCRGDEDCPGGDCVACRPFGGDGCAANCTWETALPFSLVGGVVFPDQTLVPGTSGAVVWGDPLVLGLPMQGRQQLILGKPRAGLVSAVIPASGMDFQQIPISTLACACVRGAEYRTCGGAIFQPDGSLVESCTTGFASSATSCPANRPCAPAFGPGNAASGTFGCAGLVGVNTSVTHNSCIGDPGGPMVLSFSGSGPEGSARMAEALAIGTSIGACQPSFCTDADLAAARGTPLPLQLTTCQACATVFCKNDDPTYPASPKCIAGAPVSCTNVLNGNIGGLTLAGAYTALGQQTLGDIEVTVRFVAQ
ncbi:MAG: hypothetical protein N3C12_07150 [Candidatus Binatia bacterium]|nr:hypothetical protein [Candidatus Binatia bacterium]